MHKSQAVKTNGTKLGKVLIKSIKEAKEGKSTVVYDGKWHVGEKEFDNPKDYIAYIRKQEKEKLNRMSPKKRKELKEKEKKKLARMKAQDKKREEKWAKQRAKRGFSDNWCWSIDYTLLKLIPDMVEQMGKNKNGWQPLLGYKMVNKKLVKTKEQITYKQEQEVLAYLVKGFRKLYSYLNMDDLDYKKHYTARDYRERDKKISKLHEEIFTLFKDIFYKLWD